MTAAEYCARFAGILAGIPMGMSATYAALPELTAVDGPHHRGTDRGDQQR